ncbi:MAG TPA: AsmA family protein [Candidatus Tectomicrobia bacterium]|nr:AsmA family protein [Candidatus Tectomicrobia bacterium]
MASTKSPLATAPRHLTRTLLLGLLGLVGFVLLLLVTLPYVVSLDSVKKQIVAQIEAALQRKVDVGALHLQLLSGPRAGLEDLIIYNPPGWPQPHFIKAATLSVKVAWRPLLLGRQLEITQILLSDGEIIVERDAQGRMNIADVPIPKPEPANTRPVQGQRSTPGGGAPLGAKPLPGLLVSDVTLQNMQITFVDRMVVPGQEIITTVSHFQLNLHDVALETPIPIDIAATTLTDGSRNIRVRGSVGPIPESLAVESIPINVHLRTTDVLLDELTPYLGVYFPLIQGRLGGDVEVQGSIASGLRINGTLALADAVLHETIRPYASNTLPKLTSTQKMTIDLPNGRAELIDVEISVSSLQATIKGVVHRFTATPQLDLQLTTNRFAPNEMLAQLPGLASILPTPTDMRGNVQLQAALTGTPHDLRSEARIDVHEIAWRSGSFNGGAQAGGGILLEADMADARLVTQVVGRAPPRVHIDVDVQRLIFDHRGADVPASTRHPQLGPTAQPTQSTPNLPPVRLSGNVRVAEGRIQNLDVEQLTAEFNLFEGRLNTSQQMTLYGGAYQGAMQLDLTQPEPSYTLDAKVAGLDVGRALNELTPATNMLSGVLHTDMRLSGRGFAWEMISKTLSGDGHAKLAEAQLALFDLIPTLLEVLRHAGRLAGQTIPNSWEHGTFQAVEGDWRLRQGKIFTDHLRLRGQGMEALLKGYVGLDQSIDYAGNLFLPATLIARQGTPTLLRQDEAGRVVLPFILQGTLTAPQVSFDEKALVGSAAEELVDQARKRVGDKIEGLFGKPSTGDQPRQQSDKTGQETGDQPTPRNLPEQILRELLRR